MVERSVSRSIKLSEQHDPVEIKLTLAVKLVPPEYHSVGISVGPKPAHFFQSPDTWEPLLSKGIFAGPHEAIAKYAGALESGDLEIELTDLSISVPVEELNSGELTSLGDVLYGMSAQAVQEALSA